MNGMRPWVQTLLNAAHRPATDSLTLVFGTDRYGALASLTPTESAVFTALIAERLAPLRRRHLPGPNAAIDEALDAVWMRQPVSGELEKSLLELVPDEDESAWTFGSGFVQNALAALLYAARPERPRAALQAAQVFNEAADSAAQAVMPGFTLYSAEASKRVAEHPFVVRSLEFIDADLATAKSGTWPAREVVRAQAIDWTGTFPTGNNQLDPHPRIVESLDLEDGSLRVVDWMSPIAAHWPSNLVRLNTAGTIVWFAERPAFAHRDAYTSADASGGSISAYAWSGYVVELEPFTGAITKATFTK